MSTASRCSGPPNNLLLIDDLKNLFSDSDWAGDKDSRKSTFGYIFMLNGGPVS